MHSQTNEEFLILCVGTKLAVMRYRIRVNLLDKHHPEYKGCDFGFSPHRAKSNIYAIVKIPLLTS